MQPISAACGQPHRMQARRRDERARGTRRNTVRGSCDTGVVNHSTHAYTRQSRAAALGDDARERGRDARGGTLAAGRSARPMDSERCDGMRFAHSCRKCKSDRKRSLRDL
eukprot:COSAG02_NODE_1263_length_13548_cov_13.881627_4_plen_110_part_00